MNKFLDFTLQNTEGKTITISEELQNNNVVLLFYRGTFWGAWVKQLKQVGYYAEDINETNTKYYAISVDDTLKAKVMKTQTEFPYDILVDGMDVIKQYGLVDEEQIEWDYIDEKIRKTKIKRDISLSATIIISQKGIVEYFYNGHYRYRPDNEQVLAVLKNL